MLDHCRRLSLSLCPCLRKPIPQEAASGRSAGQATRQLQAGKVGAGQALCVEPFGQPGSQTGPANRTVIQLGG